MARKSLKGGVFERELCCRLSLWMSDGEADDWYWRSSQSGGRATSRAKKGKTTKGHCGDMATTCREGEALLSVFTIEAKRGYQRAVASGLLGVTPKTAEQEFGAFIKQSRDAAGRAGTPYWMLIHRQDYRDSLVYFPYSFFCELTTPEKDACGRCERIMLKIKLKNETNMTSLVGMRLAQFLRCVSPRTVRKLHRRK